LSNKNISDHKNNTITKKLYSYILRWGVIPNWVIRIYLLSWPQEQCVTLSLLSFAKSETLTWIGVADFASEPINININ
jgi:hypothetical protein